MTINALKMPSVVVYAFLAIALAVQTCTLLYVHNHPDSAADAIMNRSPAGYALLFVLKVFKVDDEKDLTSAELSRDSVVEACRFRADYGIQRLWIAAALLGFIFVGHYAGFSRGQPQ